MKIQYTGLANQALLKSSTHALDFEDVLIVVMAVVLERTVRSGLLVTLSVCPNTAAISTTFARCKYAAAATLPRLGLASLRRTHLTTALPLV